MSRKKPKTDGIYFLGKSSEEVTGSQYLVKFGEYNCLLECGLHQSSSNSYLDSYKINSEKFKFQASSLDYVFVAHPHIDHCGLIPRLIKEGFHGEIIVTPNTAAIMKPLLLNSYHIINEEARILSKMHGRTYRPIYEEKDVYGTFGLIREYGKYNTIYKLNDCISFQWLKNSHCIGAAQLQLILNDGKKTRKILYTSDMGALKTENHYLENTEIPKMFNDIVIMESTYGDSKRMVRKKRSFDVEHLKVAINTVLGRGGSVIMPCFSFSRTQEILTTLFEIFGNDETFDTEIVVDSKLSCEISKIYCSLLGGENYNKWNDVYNWKNIHFISEKEDSRNSVANESPRIIVSASGFCTNGRVVNYLKKHLPNRNSMIIFSGYTGDNPSYLSYRIKHYKDYRCLSINKEKIQNAADCITLATFSSHANYDDLIKYGSSLKTNKLVLVHGSPEGKACLAEGLKEAISKNDGTYRVITSNRGMTIHL